MFSHVCWPFAKHVALCSKKTLLRVLQESASSACFTPSDGAEGVLSYVGVEIGHFVQTGHWVTVDFTFSEAVVSPKPPADGIEIVGFGGAPLPTKQVSIPAGASQVKMRLFTSGHGGFIDRDLYVFCGGPDGMLTAHPYVMGMSLRDFTDSAGKAAGQEVYAVAQEGEFAEVTYKWVRPGEDEHVDKIAFVTKVGDQVCGAGYYPH